MNEKNNNNSSNEILSAQELEVMNKNLQNVENISLPQGLESEKIAEKLKEIPQNVTPIDEVAPIKKNRRKRKILFRSLSAVAAVIIAVTSVVIIRPWDKIPVKIEDSVVNQEPATPEDYSEIENLFADYAKKYSKYQTGLRYNLNFFGATLEDGVAMDNATAAPESATGSYSENKGAVSVQTTNKNYGETNEQVQGVSEADIIKNDGKYLYVVNPENTDWDTYYQELEKIVFENEKLTDVTSGGTVQVSPGYNPQAVTTEETPENQTDTTGEAQTQSQETQAPEENEETNEQELPELKYQCTISIIEPTENGNFNTVSKINVAKPENENVYFMRVQEIYVSGNKLFAILNCSERTDDENGKIALGNAKFRSYYFGYRGKSLTMAVSYDISDRSNPVEEWRIYQDGSYISSRLIGDQLVVLSNYYVDISGDENQVKKNCVPEISTDGKDFERISNSCICIMEEVYNTSYLVASVMDVDNKETLKTKAVLGAGNNVYCTTETLYATSSKYETKDMAEAVFGASSTMKTQIYKFDIRNYNIEYLKSATIDGTALNQFSIDEYNGYLRIATTSGNWGDNLVNQLYVLDENLETKGLLKDIAKGETIKSVRFTGNTAYVVTFIQTDPLFVIDLSNPEAPVILGELKIPGFSTYLHPVSDGLVLGVGRDGTDTGTNGGLKVSLFDVSDPKNPKESSKITLDAVSSETLSSYIESDAYYTHKALCWDSESKTMYIPYYKNQYVLTYYTYDEITFDRHTAGVFAVKVNETDKTLEQIGNYTVTPQTAYVGGFSRVTYIGNVVYGYTQNEKGLLCSFDKATGNLNASMTLN